MKLFSFNKKERFPSIEKALKKVFTAKEYQSIIEHCPDRRMILQVASERSGKSEKELLKELANSLSMRLAPRVIATEAECLPTGMSLAVMRRAGFIAIMRDQVFRGIICSDPATIIEPYRSYEDLEILLAPWSDIANALGESEKNLENIRKDEELERREQEGVLVQKILSFLVTEVENHKKTEVKISLSQEAIQYLFTTADGKTGRGEVNRNLFAAIKRFLLAGNQVLGERSFKIRCIEAGVYYAVSWGTTEPAVEEPQLEPVSSIVPSFDSRPAFTSSVLIIDDSETFGSVIERFFVREGVAVERYTSAKKALTQLKNGSLHPRVIVCDVHMPEMNGVQFVREFRQCEEFSHINLFMLTSDEAVDTELEAIRGGVEAYLRKNEDPRLLCAHVERVLKSKCKFPEVA